MAPTNPYNAVYLQHIIYYSLDNNILPTALFLAQRLHAHEPNSPDVSYLLSLCFLRLNQLTLAAECSEAFAKTGQHLGCAYIFAQCCKGLDRYRDGITVLEPWKCLKTNHWNSHSKTLRQSSPDAAAVLLLLGQLYEGHQDTQKAVELYAQASKLNPFVWEIFTSLCNIGAKIQVQNIFEPTQEMITSLSDHRTLNVDPYATGQSFNTNLQSQPTSKSLSMNDPCNTSSRHNIQSNSGNSGNSSKTKVGYSGLSIPSQTIERISNSRLLDTTNKSYIAQDSNPPSIRETWGIGATDLSLEDALLPPKQRLASGPDSTTTRQLKPSTTGRPTRVMQAIERDFISDEMAKRAGCANEAIDRKRTISGNLVQSRLIPESTITTTAIRRSTRLSGPLRTENKPSLAASTNVKRELKQQKLGALRRLATPAPPKTYDTSSPQNILGSPQENVDRPNAIESVSQMAKFDESESRRRKESLYWLSGLLKPLGKATQRETSWVISQIARAYFENAAFKDAAKAFSKLRVMDPANMEYMDIYSTTLWHLKREVDLVFLSYELTDLQRLCPEAWCAVGNSFSLQNDHVSAVKCFKRATQLDPKFAYAFSLEGHEHVLNEEYDKAIQAYQSGVAVKRRHYSSWYGLGRVHQKLGKYDMAEKYYRIALKINPENVVLIGCIALILEQKGHLDSAMKYYNKASVLSPDSIFLRERKAGVLLKKKDVSSALVELATLRDLAPNRADIHIMLGRSYSMNGKKNLALQSFMTALALDPLGGSIIREQIDALEQDDGDDGDDSDMT